MPLPSRFLAGASAASASASRRTLATRNLLGRRLDAGAADVSQLLQHRGGVRSYGVLSRFVTSKWGGGEEYGVDTQWRPRSASKVQARLEDEWEASGEKARLLRRQITNTQKRIQKLNGYLNHMVDMITELRYRKWLKKRHNRTFEPPSEESVKGIQEHLKVVRGYLPKDTFERLDYRVDNVVYRYDQEFERLRQDILSVAQDMTQIAFASSNRRINIGLSPLPVLFRVAPLAEQTLKFQPGKDTLKFAYKPPTFEDLSVHRALRLSGSRLDAIEREIERIRRDHGIAPLAVPLRGDSFHMGTYRFRSKWSNYVGLRIPPTKQGTPRLWFQPNGAKKEEDNFRIGKNVLQVHSIKNEKKLRPLVRHRDNLKLLWYNSDDLSMNETGNGGLEKSHQKKYYASRRGWDLSHNTTRYIEETKSAGKHQTPGPRIRKIKLPEPQPTLRIRKTEDHLNDSTEETDRARKPNIIKNSNRLSISREFFGSADPKQQMVIREVKNTVATSYIPRNFFPPLSRVTATQTLPNETQQATGVFPEPMNAGTQPSNPETLSKQASQTSKGPQISFEYGTTYRPARTGLGLRNYDPLQKRAYSTLRRAPVLKDSKTTRPLNEYNLPKFGDDIPKFKRIVTEESLIRKKLQREEIHRQESLVAIRQGKEFHRGVDAAPEDMMEESDFIQALNELATSPVEDITETSGMEFMDVGDLIELRSFGGGSELGIFIQPPLKKNGNFLFLTESGRIKIWPTTGMVFTIPKFASVESAELLRKYLNQISDEDDTILLDPPRHLTKPLTDKMREFHKNALNVFSKKLPVIEKLYDNFSHETEPRLVTVHEAAQKIFPEGYENHQIYAVHLALMDNARHFIADRGRDHKKTSQFEVRSRKQLSILMNVTGWLRRETVTLETGKKGKKHSDIIYSFAQKAAALIDKSRELRDQAALFRPVEAVPMTEFAWDENDKAIIEFLKCSLERYWFQVSPVAALYPQILKATDRYREEWKLDVDLVQIFLMEIGVFRPWENIARFSTRTPLPYHQVSKEVDLLADKVAEVNKNAETAWEKLGLKDKMEEFREDITETIYAIDDPSAEEIDDGISMTHASETECWVHIHVANPTAFLEPNHWITEMAREQIQTIYLPERTFGMIPRALVDYKWGLASDRPTFTISVKVNSQSADVLDYKIRFGNAKSVKRLTYTYLNTLLGHKSPKLLSMVINPPRDPNTGEILDLSRPHIVPDLSPEDNTVLKQLRLLAIALKKKRVAAGSLSFVNQSSSISVNDHPLQNKPNSVEIDPDIPTLYKGLPTLIFSQNEPPTPAHETVAEFMLLGGNIVARFLSKHSIPAPFRAHSITPRKGAQQVLDEIILPNRNDMGFIDKALLRDHFNILGASRLQHFPATHQLLGLVVDPETGIGGYTKATSPLRRYLDMVVHFQVQQVIQNLKNNLSADTSLPFSTQYLEQELPKALNKERKIRDMQQTSEKFWIWKLIRWGTLESKAVPGREDFIPKRYTMDLTSKNQYPMPSMGMLLEFGIPMKFWFKSEEVWKKAEWGVLGEVEVDESLWSRVKVNMQWIRNLKAPKEVQS